MSTHPDESKYPGWPESFRGYYPNGKNPAGLLGSKIPLPDLSNGPDPDEVSEWKKCNNATVTETAEHFGLSRVQVVKVTGK